MRAIAGRATHQVYLQNHAFDAVTSSGMIGSIKLTDGAIERSIIQSCQAPHSSCCN